MLYVLLRAEETLQVLAIVALILAAALAVMTRGEGPPRRSGRRRARRSPRPERGEETAVALAEVAHERDVSMARASDAEERARLADDRLASLGPLEQRVEVAERRALDAERRLDEIDDRVGAATATSSVAMQPAEPDRRRRGRRRSSAARLARTAARRSSRRPADRCAREDRLRPLAQTASASTA